MSLYEGGKTRLMVDCELSDEFEVKVGIHKGSLFSYCFFAFMVDVVREFANGGAKSVAV